MFVYIPDFKLFWYVKANLNALNSYQMLKILDTRIN